MYAAFNDIQSGPYTNQDDPIFSISYNAEIDFYHIEHNEQPNGPIGNGNLTFTPNGISGSMTKFMLATRQNIFQLFELENIKVVLPIVPQLTL